MLDRQCVSHSSTFLRLDFSLCEIWSLGYVASELLLRSKQISASSLFDGTVQASWRIREHSLVLVL